jgi:N-carbamoyl-L-amino-acid hydrolase
VQEFRVDGERLWNTIMETGRIGATPRGGINRLTLSDTDREVRDWFVQACRALGCTVTIDEVGSIFARRPGSDNSREPIAIGSHLDTQPSGGRFDGIAGVLSGLEILRTLEDNHYQTVAPLELIDWTNEEGSRFAPPMLASGAFAGIYSRDFVYETRDRHGMTFLEELERIGYRGKAPVGDHKLAAYFELHIEQGPILEQENMTIGVVTGAQGQLWYEVTVRGRECHAGSTPMPMRRDAMLACARVTDGVSRIALDHAPAGMSTVGLVEVSPNSRNVIPGLVFFTIDLRHPDDNALRAMYGEFDALVKRVAQDTNTEMSVAPSVDMAPMRFNERCVGVVRDAAARLGYSHRDMVSGPGHDALNVARVAPAAMVFIPCEHGISHNEAENAKPEDVTAGANVLLHAIMEYDRRTAVAV